MNADGSLGVAAGLSIGAELDPLVSSESDCWSAPRCSPSLRPQASPPAPAAADAEKPGELDGH